MSLIRFLLLFFLSNISFFVYGKTDNEGVRISCSIHNSNEEYVSLNYIPRIRGILNYDGFVSMGSHIAQNGHLNFYTSKITDAANYALEFKNRNIPLVLFEGDDIKLDFDIENPETSLFASGKGGGKINVLNLPQFGYDSFDTTTKQNLKDFNKHIVEIISGQEKLLEAIYSKRMDDEIVLNAKNKGKIQRIIKSSPLTEKEYNFLLNRIHFQKYKLLTGFLSKISNTNSLEGAAIHLDNPVFNCFDKEKYKRLDNINDWHLAHSLESILQIEYLRHLIEKEGTKVTYGKWQSLLNNSEYINWAEGYLKANFNEDVYNKYFADTAAWLMTLGYDYGIFLNKINTCDGTNKYALRLNAFKELLDNGLNNVDFVLNNSSSTLDMNNFNSVLKGYEKKPLIIVFWSAQFAGASIVDNLKAIKSFEKKNKGKVEIINVCVDKEINKNIWAARIIDNSWRSEHYFLPIEGNDSVLDRFGGKKISEFCDGGAVYAFMNSAGKISNDIDFPFHKSAMELDEMFK